MLEMPVGGFGSAQTIEPSDNRTADGRGTMQMTMQMQTRDDEMTCTRMVVMVC